MNPPLIEAICEFQFELDAPWNRDIEGSLYEKVHAAFPEWHQIAQMNTNITTTSEITEPQSEDSHLIQFLRDDEKAIIQTGPHFLAVSHLKPYPSWSEFLALIDSTFKTYREAVNPTQTDSIKLNYINRIEIIGEDIRLGDYFEFSPFIGKRMPQSFGAFIVGIQVPYEHDPVHQIVGQFLRNLRANRNIADYEDIVIDLSGITKVTLVQAEQVISLVSTL